MFKEGDRVCVECGGVNEHRPGCSRQSDQEFSVISVYSRQMAIEDGVLVDCSQSPFDRLNREAGIKVHVAMTAQAFDAYVHPLGTAPSPIRTTQNENAWHLDTRLSEPVRLPPGQDMLGRYWDIVWMLRLAM